jgi:hypothetical protein
MASKAFNELEPFGKIDFGEFWGRAMIEFKFRGRAGDYA